MDDKSVQDGSAADGIIAQLRDGGELHAEGRFTMDREEARARLGEFQLPDPRWGLLLLVRAAVRRGASHLDIEVDADDIRIVFNGTPFTELDFENLYLDPLSDVVREKDAGRAELALGLLAALGLGPRHIKVQSGAGDEGAELELRPGQPDRYGPAESPHAGTAVHIKLRKGLMVRAMARYGDVLPEVALLRERCQYASIPVTLNRQRISHGLDLPGVAGRVPIRGVGIVGVAGFWRGAAESPGVRVVKHGVWIAELTPQPGPRELGVVLRADGIRTDLTQFGLVQDEAHAALTAAADRGWRDAVSAVVTSFEKPSPDGAPDRAWIRETLRAAAQRFDTLEDYRSVRPDPLALRLSRLPIWQTLLTGSAPGGYRSLDLFLRRAQRSIRLAYARQDQLNASDALLERFVPNLPTTCVLTESEGDTKLLQKLLGDRLVYCTEFDSAELLPPRSRAKPTGATEEQRWRTATGWALGIAALLASALLVARLLGWWGG